MGRIELVFGAFNDHDIAGIVEEWPDGVTFDDPFQNGPLTGDECQNRCLPTVADRSAHQRLRSSSLTDR